MKFLFLFLYSVVVLSACSKSTPGPDHSVSFCRNVTSGNIDDSKPYIDSYFATLDTDIPDQMKMDLFVDWLKSHDCISNVELIHVNGIETLPTQSEVAIYYYSDISLTTERIILDIWMGEYLTYNGSHQ